MDKLSMIGHAVLAIIIGLVWHDIKGHLRRITIEFNGKDKLDKP